MPGTNSDRPNIILIVADDLGWKDLGFMRERNNLAKKSAGKAKQLHRLLKEWRKSTGASVPAKRNPDYDAAFEKQLINAN